MPIPDYIPPETGRPQPESPEAERRRLKAAGVVGPYAPAPRRPSAPLSPDTLATLDAIAHYGGPADFVDPEAATPEPFPLVPPDLTHALSELVMLYGPEVVKLAAARY